MKSVKPAAFVFALGVIAVVVTGSSAGSAQRGQGWPAWWAYAEVSTDASGVVLLSYAAEDGCRVNKVEVDPVRGLQGIDMSATEALATARAVSQLGHRGWEMIGEGTSYCHGGGRKAIHFKLAH